MPTPSMLTGQMVDIMRGATGPVPTWAAGDDPVLSWTEAKYQKVGEALAQAKASPEESDDEDKHRLGRYQDDYKRFGEYMARGWSPAYDDEAGERLPGVWEGVKETYAPGPHLITRPPGPEQEDIGRLPSDADVDALLSEFNKTEESLPNASKLKALNYSPEYWGDDRIDALKVNMGEIPMPGVPVIRPYYHHEPSLNHVKRYMQSIRFFSKNSGKGDKWDEDWEELEAIGIEAEVAQIYKDNLWGQVRAAFVEEGHPVLRVEYMTSPTYNLFAEDFGTPKNTARLWETSRGTAFAAAFGDMASFGILPQAAAMVGNQSYHPRARAAIERLEKADILLPMSGRIEDVQAASPWAGGIGMAAGALMPGAGPYFAGKLAMKGMAKLGKPVSKLAGKLLGKTPQAVAASGLGRYGAGMGTALMGGELEIPFEAAVTETGRLIRGEAPTPGPSVLERMGQAAPLLMGTGAGFTAVAGGVKWMTHKLMKSPWKDARGLYLNMVGDAMEAAGERRDPTATFGRGGLREPKFVEGYLKQATELQPLRGRPEAPGQRVTGVDILLDRLTTATGKVAKNYVKALHEGMEAVTQKFYSQNLKVIPKHHFAALKKLIEERGGITYVKGNELLRKSLDTMSEVHIYGDASKAQKIANATGGIIVDAEQASMLGVTKKYQRALNKAIELGEVPMVPQMTEAGHAIAGPSPGVRAVLSAREITGKQHHMTTKALYNLSTFEEGVDEILQDLGEAIRKDRKVLDPQWNRIQEDHSKILREIEVLRSTRGFPGQYEAEELQFNKLKESLKGMAFKDNTDLFVFMDRAAPELRDLAKQLMGMEAYLSVGGKAGAAFRAGRMGVGAGGVPGVYVGGLFESLPLRLEAGGRWIERGIQGKTGQVGAALPAFAKKDPEVWKMVMDAVAREAEKEEE